MLLIIVADAGLFHEIGVAALIAALLGFSIDFYLHRSIAKDAFEGAMGYFLPDDIKEAVRYIGAIDWFAEEFSLTINLKKIDDETIKCTLKIRKYMKNISSGKKSIKSHVHVDEWGRREKSYIISCEARTASITKNLNPQSIRSFDSTVYAETDLVDVHPGETIELLAEAVEYKDLNDNLHYALGYAAKSPKIYIEPLQGFEIRAGISADTELQRHAHMPVYELPGFYLPWQRMMVRWWPANGKGASAEVAVENIRREASER
jgi:hypothetical protein